ncbi:MAG TPA: glycoside hydrolase [Gammaproteobacteria bacterium]|nr:glycoside hydrolase [Gammaproteobacteria bacterium]
MSAEGAGEGAAIHVVLCWHMHQPQYCDLISGEYKLPWTYLHAIKDYVDMAAHLEAVPGARAVVNFAPVLLEQIDDYAAQVSGHLRDSKPIRDPLLAALADPVLPPHVEPRMGLINACLRVNRHRVIERFPAYARLAKLAEAFLEHCDEVAYASDQFIADLLVWYHLGWMAETVRRDDLRVQRLQEKGQGFTLHERRELLTLIGELLSGIVDRYRALAERGQVELSVTPYAHPIAPLLLDLHCAREAMPEVELPEVSRYPGGRERARWHIQEGITVFEQYFGRKPDGCWPAEGGVSAPTLGLLQEYGFRWAATGESVLRNSLRQYDSEEAAHAPDAVMKAYQLSRRKIACFFRHDGLSDEIGFTYSDWHADDAVANLVHRLEQMAEGRDGRRLVVPIILDGENAWEHYPENGYYFLRALYEKLAAHPRLRMSTFSECLDAGVETARLGGMVSGSWVYGTFSTWIGDRDKNRGWEMLVDAKKVYDRVVRSGRLDSDQRLAAQLQLAICEGSDWFWWFGDYNPSDTVSDFEALFRLHLSNLYQLLGVEAPEYLAHTFARGSGTPAVGGVMRHGQARDQGAG